MTPTRRSIQLAAVSFAFALVLTMVPGASRACPVCAAGDSASTSGESVALIGLFILAPLAIGLITAAFIMRTTRSARRQSNREGNSNATASGH